jgi:hypothetical protein
VPVRVSQEGGREEAMANMREAIRLCVAGLEDDRLPAPAERFEAFAVPVRAACRGFRDASVMPQGIGPWPLRAIIRSAGPGVAECTAQLSPIPAVRRRRRPSCRFQSEST